MSKAMIRQVKEIIAKDGMVCPTEQCRDCIINKYGKSLYSCAAVRILPFAKMLMKLEELRSVVNT